MCLRPKFIYRKHLDSHIWNPDSSMRSEVRVALMGIVNQVLTECKNAKIPFDASDIQDVFLHGSMANYYYDKHSDIDVCVVCNFSRVSHALPGINISLLLKTMAKATFAHMMPFIVGRKVDIAFADVYSPRYGKNRYKVGGCYSVLRDKWVHKTVRLDKRKIQQIKYDAKRLYRDMRYQVFDVLLEKTDFSRVEALTNALMCNRKSAYASSPEQPITPYVIAYRMLKESGLLPKAYERTMKLRAAGKK